jgi:hypothetical protein
MPFEEHIGDSAPEINTRKTIGKRKRFEIFKRDNFTCQYCGSTPPAVILHVDHILAVANGGGNETENLTTACQGCNLGKSAVPLSVKPQSLEAAADDAREAAEQVREHAKMVREARIAMEDVCWEIAEVLHHGAGKGWSHDKFNGVKGFVKRLGYSGTLEAAYIAADKHGEGSRRFKYFCGICWNRVREAAE